MGRGRVSLPLTIAEIRAALAGRYESVHRIAAGGQATVFKAKSVADGQTVALKIYHSGQVEERTKREMKALSALDNKSIVRLSDVGELAIDEGKFQYIATQFIDGEPLSHALSRGPMPIQSVASMGRDVALAIEALWKHRLVHRDIKPANVMQKANGQSVVIGLGIARHMHMSSITTAGVAWGTPGYMSPEQMLAQRALTCRSDIFSLGIVIQEAMLGSHPVAFRQQLLLRGGVPTASLRPKVDPMLRDLVDRMVQERSALRPNPAEVATMLNTIASRGP